MDAEERQKWGRPSIIHLVNNVRWTEGGRGGGGGGGGGGCPSHGDRTVLQIPASYLIPSQDS